MRKRWKMHSNHITDFFLCGMCRWLLLYVKIERSCNLLCESCFLSSKQLPNFQKKGLFFLIKTEHKIKLTLTCHGFEIFWITFYFFLLSNKHANTADEVRLRNLILTKEENKILNHYTINNKTNIFLSFQNHDNVIWITHYRNCFELKNK